MPLSAVVLPGSPRGPGGGMMSSRAMPYRMTIKPPVLYASWRGFTLAELREVVDRLGEMRRSTGHPVAYLARIPAGEQAFTDLEQRAFHDFFVAALPHCATIHIVIEGDGFLKSGRLAIATKLVLATTRPRDIHTHPTIEEGLRQIKSLYGVELSDPFDSAPPPETPERASGAFRYAARLAESGRNPPRRGS
jgi:hypothetical protein